MAAPAAAAISPHAGGHGRLSAATALLDAPLALPSSLSKQTFYLSPLANPDLVLALIIPGHPLYSGHAIAGSPHGEGVAAAAAHEVAAAGKAVTHFWQSAANTVTNSAASAIGVKNSLELSKPKLRLVPRAAPGSNPLHSLNQKWLVLKRDGCIYSCVEESAERGGGMFRLGDCRNQMVRAESRDAGGITGAVADMGATPGANGTPRTPPGSELLPPATMTRESSTSSASSYGASTPGRLSTIGDESMTPAARAAAGLLSVTTAGGETVLCPLRWRVGAPVTSEQIKEGLSVQGMHCVIEDLEGGSSSSSSSSSAGRDSSKLLVIKNSCCGNLDCELEKIDAGSAVAFRSEKDAELTTDECIKAGGGKAGGSSSPATPSTPSSTGSSALLSGAGSGSKAGPNIKQVWRVESDFSLWLSTLSRSVSTEYSITRKLQAIEADRKRVRRETRDPEPHVPLKLSIDYEYVPVWSTEGTKASSECSIWRPRSLGAAGAVFLGDFAHGSKAPPPTKQSLFVAPALNGALHRALVRPRDFELVYCKKKGKLGNLWVWNPLPPLGVDALALGHIATTGKDEALAKPELNCGIVLVMREYCKDANHALSSLLWTDAHSGGGPIGSLWRVPHLHTFFCNPGSHQQPSGSYWVLLEPAEVPEKCPLLRPMETTNVHWEPVWDDKGTLAKMDISVWRPEIEKTFVRFGDQVCRGHSEPSNLAVVAKDHPAFRRPLGYQLVTKLYRGARKCYVYKPLPPTEHHVALGYIVMATKEEPPPLDLLRCVHRDALIPLGILKQMWIEHHEGMMSTLTLGLGALLKVSKEYPINMLWKNRSLNTFIAVQNTHARPEAFAAGAVYRLTMTAGELAWTVSRLESHARWVLESLYGALSGVEKVLAESSYKRLSLSAQQVAALLQAVKSIFHLMRSGDSVAPPSLTSPGSAIGSPVVDSRSSSSSVSGGSAAPFKVSASFTEYLLHFESSRMRAVERSLKRYLYSSICEDIADHESTLEMLDECWELVNMMPDVHRVTDAVDEWVPAYTGRFPASQTKSLSSILLDDKIGNEVFERFLKLFPPRVPSILMGDEDAEEKEQDEELPQLKHAASVKAAHPGSPQQAAGFTEVTPDPDAARAELMARRASSNAAAVKQLEDTKATLAKLSTLSDELELVIVITSSMEIRKRYLEYYQNYLTHTLTQEFPVQGSVARSAATGHKLGMSSLLAVVRWVCEYIELVGDHLLEGNFSEAREVLGKMEDLVDRLMDVHDELTKEKILTWISNLLRQEERASVELLEADPDSENKGKRFYYTSGAQDLFLNINMLFDSQSENLTGRPLARIALVHVHVLTYYQQVQAQFFKQVAAINDGTTHETVKGKNSVSTMKHAGSLDKPYAYILAQINNSKKYQMYVEDLSDRVIQRLSATDAPDELIASLEDAFAACSEEFETLALSATDVLLRHIQGRLSGPISKLCTSAVWFADEEYFQSAVLDELDELSSHFVPNMEPNICATHLLRETARFVFKTYLRQFVASFKPNLGSHGMSLEPCLARLRTDRDSFRAYCESCSKWSVWGAVEKSMPKWDLVLEFLAADVDFIRLQMTEIPKVFANDSEFSPAVMTNCLLSIRSDIASEDKKAWLAPYAAELKARKAEEERLKSPSTPLGSIGGLFTSGKSSDKKIAPDMTPTADLSAGTYGLEIVLLKGTDLVVRDISTSDPYVNVLLIAVNGGRIAKAASRVIKATLNPVWNESFLQWKTRDVSALDHIRFEVWDKDFLSKDFMGWADVSVSEIREKQLRERKASVRGGVDDYTQDPINFHLKLAQMEGKKNEGSHAVSGAIDVRIRYFKLTNEQVLAAKGGVPVSKAAPSAAASSGGKGSAAPGGDDLDFTPEDQGQTGSRRPQPSMDGAGAGSSAAASSYAGPDSPSSGSGPPLSLDRSSSSVLSALSSGAPLWNDISSSIKLAKLPVAGSHAEHAAGGAPSGRRLSAHGHGAHSSHHGSSAGAAPVRSRTLQSKLKAAPATIPEEGGPAAGKGKKIGEKGAAFNIFAQA